MLEKPDFPDDTIISCLQDEFGLTVTELSFLPLGADRNTAVYRAVAAAEIYFVKLRRGGFDEISVLYPKFLSDQGIEQIIAPIPTSSGKLWAALNPYTLILYPFIDGRNGYEVALTDQQWVEFGMALRKIHTTRLPARLSARIQREVFAPQGRETVRAFLERIESEVFAEPIMAKLAAFLRTHRAEVLALVERTEQLAQALRAYPAEYIVCHADLHAGNLLLQASGRFYIVDWDAPILAPRERDLMFVGGGQFGSRRAPKQEEALFYQGYGQTILDQEALAYYRYERIIQDLAVECEQIFLSEAGGEDREQAFQYLTSNFRPGSVLEIARKADPGQDDS